MDPRTLAILFVVFVGLSLFVLRRLYRLWNVERHALAELPNASSPPERLSRYRRLGWRLASLTAAVAAMVALAFAAPLGAPRPVLEALRLVAIVALGAGVYLTVRP